MLWNRIFNIMTDTMKKGPITLTGKAVITFTGVLPDGDDCTGHWGLITRTISVPFTEDKPTKNQVLQSLREGNFTVQIEEEDQLDYIKDVLEQDNIVSVATSSTSYEEFYKGMLSQLHTVGYEAYVEEFGVEQKEYDEDEDNEEDYDDNEFLDENGVNGEGFAELMFEYSHNEIEFEMD